MLLRREADTRLLSRILLCLLTPYTNSRGLFKTLLVNQEDCSTPA